MQLARPLRHSLNAFSKLAGLLVILAACGISSARGQQPEIREIQGSPLPAPSERATFYTPQAVREGKATLMNHYNPSQKLRLVLNIQPPHLADEDAFVKSLTTKGSPDFHKFLSQDEWNARFAPSAADEQSVVDWAQSVGLTVTKRFPNRLLVDVEATSGTIEQAFGVTINNYQVGDEIDFANDRNPVIPSKLSGVLSAVVGLNNIERLQRMGTSMPTLKGADYVAGPAITPLQKLQHAGDPSKAPWNKPATVSAKQKESPLSTGFGANDSYPVDNRNGLTAMDPASVQSSQGYDFNALQRFSGCCNVFGNSAGSPPESSIALVGFGNYNASDIVTFFQAYGLAYNVTPYCIDGSTCPAVDGEAPLDVEYSVAMSNSYGSYLDTAAIYEYEMTNNYWTTFEDAYNDVLSDGKAKIVSTSYGGSEDSNSTSASIETGTMHSILNNMIASGITLIAASGDKGAAADGSTTSVQYPSSDPDFLAAGGTQLNLYSNGTFESETAWQGNFDSSAWSNNYGGSTGGRSVLFAAPYWQTMNNGSTGTYPNGVQSPYYSWQTVNGTTTEYVNTNYNSRLLPDLSLTANPSVLGQWYYSGGQWLNYGGGTSIVAPELAGFFAQENSYLDKIGNVCGSGSSPCSPVGLASPFIYDAGLFGAPHDPFYDMTSGCNDNNVTVANSLFYYCAYTGYDPITGWGSANMMQLAWAINWQLIPAAGSPSLTFTGPSTNVWHNTDQVVGWTLSDAGSGSYPAPGALGFTQGWDSIPSDSYSLPHGGDGDSFYAGPEFINPVGGCLSFNGASGCAGGNQGCHTAYVRGWDNQGRTTYASYGPVCVDTVAPTSSASLSGATNGSVYTGAVTVTIASSDTTSGIAHTYYSLDGAGYTGYGSPFTVGATARGPHTLYYYSIDNAGNYSSVKSASFTISSVTTTMLTSSLNPSIYGEAVTFKAAVTSNPSGAPTGAVNFVSGSTVLGSANITNGVASFTVANLGVGNAHIDATYVGNTSYLASSSSAIAEVINKASSTTAVTSSLNPSYHGQAVTFKATVTPSHGGTADGTVKFLNGSNVLGTATLSGNVASLVLSNLSVGTTQVSASYAGNNNIAGSNSSAVAETVNKAETTLTLASSANPSSYGASVTFTAKVVAASGAIPIGTVTFKNGLTVIGPAALNAAGVATLSTSTLPVGTASITASYGGSANNVGSVSAAISETIAEAKTTTTVTSSLNPAPHGTAVTFTAKVVAASGAIPTGTITFKSGSTVIGTGALNTTGVATLTTSTLPVGTASITADYGGSANDVASVSAVLAETIAEAKTATTVTSSLNPAPRGESVTFTAKVVAASGAIPSGTVTFKSGSTVIGTGTLNTAGLATLATTTLPVGTDSITADYGGSANDVASVSAVLSETIAEAKTTTTLTSSLNPAPHGIAVTFTAKVVAASGAIPSGTVTFKSGSTVIGTGTLNTAGVATLATSTLPVGTVSITADYGGSANDVASISAVLAETIAEAKTTTTVMSSLNPAPHGESVTFTAKVVAASGAIPTGTITFKSGTTVIGTGTLNTAGVATLATSTLPVGTASITADYVGSANDVASVSSVLSETIAEAKTITTVTSSLNPAPHGTAVTFTAKVVAASGAIPTGTITFKSGSTVIGIGTLNTAGVATLAISTLPVGTVSITADYGGSTNDTASISAVLSQVSK